MSAIVVGNEVLPNNALQSGGLPVEQVRAAIQQVRATLHDLVPITVADEYYVWLQHLDLLNDVDFITVHIYPFWDKCSIDSAIQCLNSAYQKVQQAVHARFPHMQIVIGETGWPSNGPPYGAAVPSPANQARYLRDFTNWARLHGVQYYYFDAFDESWKGTFGNGEYGVGANWGIYQKDGVLKPTLSGLLPVAAAETLHERSYLDLYVGTGLEECFSLGLDTSGQQHDWLTDTRGSLLLVYPPGQQWGTMYITAGSPFSKCQRPSLDLSAYHSLAFDMRAAVNGQCVHVGIKDVSKPSNGSEITMQECLTTQRSTFTLPLLSTFPNVDLAHLSVLFEVNFSGPSSVTIELSNIRYSPT